MDRPYGSYSRMLTTPDVLHAARGGSPLYASRGPPRVSVHAYAVHLRAVHWLTAVIVAAQLITAAIDTLVCEAAPLAAEFAVQCHISCGVLIVVLTLARVGVRNWSVAPPMAPGGSCLPRSGAIVVHSLS